MDGAHMIVSGGFGRIDVRKIDNLEYKYNPTTNVWVGSFLVDYNDNIYLFDMASAGYKNNTLYVFENRKSFPKAIKFKSVDFSLGYGLRKQENFIRFFSPQRLTV